MCANPYYGLFSHDLQSSERAPGIAFCIMWCGGGCYCITKCENACPKRRMYELLVLFLCSKMHYDIRMVDEVSRMPIVMSQ